MLEQSEDFRLYCFWGFKERNRLRFSSFSERQWGINSGKNFLGWCLTRLLWGLGPVSGVPGNRMLTLASDRRASPRLHLRKGPYKLE